MLSLKGKSKSILIVLFISILGVFILTSCDKAKETMDDASNTVKNAAEKAGEVASETADKAGEMAEEAADKVSETAGEAADKVSETAEGAMDKASETAGDVADKVADAVSSDAMVGVWTGKLDSRATTLTITSQDGNSFEGKITINYRNPINQEVKGSVSEDGNTMTMEDQLHSRYKGAYKGTLSEDGTKVTGTFTTLVDKKNYNFSLTKK